MPAEPKQRVYWDTCVILSYLQETRGRIGEIEALLQEQREGKFEIVTSLVTRAEVVFVAEMEADNSLAMIDGIWAPDSPITPLEVFDQIVMDAQRLILRAKATEGLSKLTPVDAIHVASAAKYASKMQTYDEKLHSFSNAAGIPIGFPVAAEPQLDSEPPNSSRYLF
jgi:predicted nucleic acid-binding protein